MDAREALSRDPQALRSWAPMYLFYGCRRADEDFLYRDEWPGYLAELPGILHMETAFSRQGPSRSNDPERILFPDVQLKSMFRTY